jgi:hypothetical protein
VVTEDVRRRTAGSEPTDNSLTATIYAAGWCAPIANDDLGNAGICGDAYNNGASVGMSSSLYMRCRDHATHPAYSIGCTTTNDFVAVDSVTVPVRTTFSTCVDTFIDCTAGKCDRPDQTHTWSFTLVQGI